MDIAQYCKRINYKGLLSPTLETLKALHESHLLSVPFENLDVFDKETILLDTKQIYKKIILGNRGGVCFEINGLFYEFLIEVGFDVNIISARVYRKSGNVAPEYDHLALVCKLDGQNYLVDVGYGELMNFPLKVGKESIHKDKRGIFRVMKHDSVYFELSKKEGEKWDPIYLFSLEKRNLEDFKESCRNHEIAVANRTAETRRLCSIQTDTGRITLTDNVLILEEETIKKIKIKNKEDYSMKLWEIFGFALPDKPIHTVDLY